MEYFAALKKNEVDVISRKTGGNIAAAVAAIKEKAGANLEIWRHLISSYPLKMILLNILNTVECPNSE